MRPQVSRSRSSATRAGVVRKDLSGLARRDDGAAGDADRRLTHELRAMPVDPAGCHTARGQALDPERANVEAIEGRLAVTTRAEVAQGADHVDRVPDQGRGMEVRRWKDALGIPEDPDRTVRLVDEDVVVDAEVRVVGVLVLAADLHDTAVGQRS